MRGADSLAVSSPLPVATVVAADDAVTDEVSDRETDQLTDGMADPIADPVVDPPKTGRSAVARRRRALLIALLAILGLIVVVAVLAPVLAPRDPSATKILERFRPPIGMHGATWKNPLGTDGVGRDSLSRMLFGLRASLTIGFAALAVSGTIGVLAGIVSGFYDGRVAAFIFGRLADVQQATPFVVLALAVAASVGPSFKNLILILGVGSWLFYYRVVRAEVLALREENFIDAARTIGSSDLRVLIRHVLPNVFPSIIVMMTLWVPRLIMFAAALSFLGLGVQAPQPELGAMIADGRDFIQTAWWISVLPGVVLAVIVLLMNTLGDLLRDQLDPTQRGRE